MVDYLGWCDDKVVSKGAGEGTLLGVILRVPLPVQVGFEAEIRHHITGDVRRAKLLDKVRLNSIQKLDEGFDKKCQYLGDSEKHAKVGFKM